MLPGGLSNHAGICSLRSSEQALRVVLHRLHACQQYKSGVMSDWVYKKWQKQEGEVVLLPCGRLRHHRQQCLAHSLTPWAGHGCAMQVA